MVMVLSCIDIVEVILGDWRDTGAGLSENCKSSSLALCGFKILCHLAGLDLGAGADVMDYIPPFQVRHSFIKIEPHHFSFYFDKSGFPPRDLRRTPHTDIFTWSTSNLARL